MGNSASALPYTIDDLPTHDSTRAGSCGFAIHKGKRKSDGMSVTVFKASKKNLAKTPLLELPSSPAGGGDSNVAKSTSWLGGGKKGGIVKKSANGEVDMVQIFPALHHFHSIKKMIHPDILRVYDSLDTDIPSGTIDSRAATNGGVNHGSLSGPNPTPITGDLIIVTEEVIPLRDYLNNLAARSDPNSPLYDYESKTSAQVSITNASRIAWGLRSIVNSLHFVHVNMGCAHGRISLDSIYVTPSGDFKLSDFFLLTPIGILDDGRTGPTPAFRAYERDCCPSAYRSIERKEGRWDVIGSSGPHCMDSFSLGVLIDEMYSHNGCGTSCQLPEKLIKAVQRLRTDDIRIRPVVLPLLKCPVFVRDEHVAARIQLFEMSNGGISSERRLSYYQGLVDSFKRKTLNKEIAMYTVLPLLFKNASAVIKTEGSLEQEVNRRELLAIIPPVFYIGEHCLSSGGVGNSSTTKKGADELVDNAAKKKYKDPKELFRQNMLPVIELLFTVNDRGVRGTLLSRIELFSTHLDSVSLNSKVFEPTCSGFTDTSPQLRELTLRSTLHLVKHLTPANLEKLVRYLVRLQGDTEDGIRTNAIIFVGRVSSDLSEAARDKFILPAFVRAMKDNFPPCRLAALRSIMSCSSVGGVENNNVDKLYDPARLAKEVLPCVVPHLVDEAADVRFEAFRVVDSLLQTLRAETTKMPGIAESNTSVRLGSIEKSAGNDLGLSKSEEKNDVPTDDSSSAGYLGSLGSWASSKITRSSATTTSTIATSSSLPNISSTIVTSKPTNITTPETILSVPRKEESRPLPKFSSLGLSDVSNTGSNIYHNDGENIDLGGDDVEPVSIPSWTTGNDDDFMSQFEKKPALRIGGEGGGGSGGGRRIPVGGSKLMTNVNGRAKLMAPSAMKKKTAVKSDERKAMLARKKEERKTTAVVAAKKLSIVDDDSVGIEDGWDDF